MHTLFHIILIFFSILLYFHISKHIDYIHASDNNNSFFIEYKNNRELQQLCDKDKILIFDSPCNLVYNGIVHLSNSYDDETIEVPYDAFIKLMYCKKKSYYFSNNTPILYEHQELSSYIHNPISVNQQCFLLGGPCGYSTPHLFHTFHRKFLFVASGSIQLKLQPLKPYHNIDTNIKNLHYSVGNVEPYDDENIDLKSGQIVFIPHNYIYKMIYCEDVNVVYDLTCHSISSLSANLKDIILHKIQTRNVSIKNFDIDADEMIQLDNITEPEPEPEPEPEQKNEDVVSIDYDSNDDR